MTSFSTEEELSLVMSCMENMVREKKKKKKTSERKVSLGSFV